MFFKRKTVFDNKADGSDGITVILTVWKRDHLREQLDCICNQSDQPVRIWVYQCGNYVDVDNILKGYSGIDLIKSTVNLKYFGRFLLAQFVETRYVFIVDDDVIPSLNWLNICRTKCEELNSIISSTGRIIPRNDYLPERMINVKDFFYGDTTSYLGYNFCKADTVVDFGCNSWFIRSDWIKTFWKTAPYTLETAEDIHLSASCMLNLDIDTVVPKQINEETSGNLRKDYGKDMYATWLKPDFQESREGVLRYFIDHLGWTPQLWRMETLTVVVGFLAFLI